MKSKLVTCDGTTPSTIFTSENTQVSTSNSNHVSEGSGTSVVLKPKKPAQEPLLIIEFTEKDFEDF